MLWEMLENSKISNTILEILEITYLFLEILKFWNLRSVLMIWQQMIGFYNKWSPAAPGNQIFNQSIQNDTFW